MSSNSLSFELQEKPTSPLVKTFIRVSMRWGLGLQGFGVS